MNRKYSTVISIFSFLLVFMATEQPIQAQSVRTNAYVNLLDGPFSDEDVGPNATASSQSSFSSQSSEASASSIAVPQALGSNASSSNVGLSYPSSGDAGFFEDYWFVGDLPQTSQSATLELILNVSLQCLTVPGDAGSIASVLVSYDFYSEAGRRKGTAQIGCQAGLPVLVIFGGGFSDGDLTTTAIAKATLTPTIDFGGVIEKLTVDDLDFLGLLDLDLTLPLEQLAAEVDVLVGLVAAALNQLGLPRLGILPGLGLDVGFSVDNQVRGAVSIPLKVSSSGFLGGFVNAIASSGGDAQAFSSISGAIQSATLPMGFPDLEPLELDFESGRRLKVYPAETLIFTDIFEFGDTSTWSATSP